MTIHTLPTSPSGLALGRNTDFGGLIGRMIAREVYRAVSGQLAHLCHLT